MGKIWLPTEHITIIDTRVYIKIKSHRDRSNGYPKNYARPQPRMALVHSNHWADKTCELPHTDPISHPVPLRCNTTRILSLLCIQPINMNYVLYPVDTDVSDFTAIVYQTEIILRLATKSEMDYYVRNMVKLQPPPLYIGFMGPTRRVITHQAIIWTYQLYKDKNTRVETQLLHHLHPATPLATTTVIDTMEIHLFCETAHAY